MEDDKLMDEEIGEKDFASEKDFGDEILDDVPFDPIDDGDEPLDGDMNSY